MALLLGTVPVDTIILLYLVPGTWYQVPGIPGTVPGTGTSYHSVEHGTSRDDGKK